MTNMDGRTRTATKTSERAHMGFFGTRSEALDYAQLLQAEGHIDVQVDAQPGKVRSLATGEPLDWEVTVQVRPIPGHKPVRQVHQNTRGHRGGGSSDKAQCHVCELNYNQMQCDICGRTADDIAHLVLGE